VLALVISYEYCRARMGCGQLTETKNVFRLSVEAHCEEDGDNVDSNNLGHTPPDVGDYMYSTIPTKSPWAIAGSALKMLAWWAIIFSCCFLGVNAFWVLIVIGGELRWW